jgi:hypothetical protein
MIQFGLDLTHALDKQLNVSAKTVLSQRDVPGMHVFSILLQLLNIDQSWWGGSLGMTRSMIPILAANGVKAISVTLDSFVSFP